MKSRFIIIFIFSFLTFNIFCQSWKELELNYVQNLTWYRGIILTKDTAELRQIKNFNEKFLELEPNDELRTDILNSIIQYTDGYSNKINKIKKFIKKNYSDHIIADSLKENDIATLKNNSYILDLIFIGALNSNFPFSIANDKEILEELEFYDLKDGQTIAEIGAGKGTFSLLMFFVNPSIKFFINDVDLSFWLYLGKQIEFLSNYINTDNLLPIIGRKHYTNIEGKVDKVIVRNAYHHFNQLDMLFSIKENLKFDGYLYILEAFNTPDNIKNICHKLLSRDEIMQNTNYIGFELVDEKSIGERTILKFKPTQK